MSGVKKPASELIGKSRYERRLHGLTCREIAEQDGCNAWAVSQSVDTYALRSGLPMPDKEVIREKVAQRRLEKAMAGLHACHVCKRELPVDAFIRRDSSQNTGYSVTRLCRECRNEQKRENLRRKTEAAGKTFTPRGDRAEYEARVRVERAKREAERLARREAEREARRQKHEADRVERAERYMRWLAEHSANAEARRQHLTESPELTCQMCKRLKSRDDFHPSIVACGKLVCKACLSVRDARKFQRDKETISDRYVKRQLTKHTGIASSAIPQSMIEAKRVQLLIDRAMPSWSQYADWIVEQLRHGPLIADELNRRAEAAGFSPRDSALRRIRRRAGAVYDEATNTWRIG